MAQQLLNVGTYARDATGDKLRDGNFKIQQNFAELFFLAGLGAPATSALNMGKTPNSSPPGTVMSVETQLINQDFLTLFTFVGQPSLDEVILEGGEPGMVIGQYSAVIGTGDPGRVMGRKINACFTYLYMVI